MANRKAVGPDKLPNELLKFVLDDDDKVLKRFHDTIFAVYNGGGAPQKWKDTTITILHKKKDRIECGNDGGISLVARTAKCSLR